MAIKVNNLSHWALNVKDMKASLAFYCDLLGFPHVQAYQREGKPWIEYVKVAKERFIELFHAGEGQDFYETIPSFSHICLTVKDIHQLEKALNDAGWPIDSPIRQGKTGNSQLWAKDPDGNRIEFMQINPDSPQAK